LIGRVIEDNNCHQGVQMMEPRTTMNYRQPMHPEYAPHPSPHYYPPAPIYPQYYPSALTGMMPNGQYYYQHMPFYYMPMSGMPNIPNIAHMPSIPSMPTLQNIPISAGYPTQPKSH
jgi:hypothetical protein